MEHERNFLSLITAHQAIIHKICCMYHSNRSDREDLFQEIILQAWKSFPNFRGESQFQTWLYRLALNTAITNLKKEDRKTQAEEHFQKEYFCEIPYHENEEVLVMYKAIAQLSKIEKALVALYLEDYSYDLIAETMGITANLVAVKILRIKIKLKNITQNQSSLWN